MGFLTQRVNVMTREQRILERVRYITRTIVLGAGRTSALDDLRAKFHISDERLRSLCLFQSGCEYWK